MVSLRTSGPDEVAERATRALGVARTAIGLTMLAVPALLPRLLGADRLTARRIGYLARMVGIRELVLGVGTLDAQRAGTGVRTWVLAQAISDAGDAASVGIALRRGHVGRFLGAAIVLAGTAGAAGDVWVSTRLGRRT